MSHNYKLVVFALLLTLMGCEKTWIADQHQKCRAIGGWGTYSHNDKLFECFASKKPFTFKLEFNKEVDFKRAERVKLFEARYE